MENQERSRKPKRVKNRNSKRETTSSTNEVKKPEASISTVNQPKNQKLMAIEDQGRSIKRKGVKHRNSKCEISSSHEANDEVVKQESSMPVVNQLKPQKQLATEDQEQSRKRKRVKHPKSKCETFSPQQVNEVKKPESPTSTVDQPKSQKLPQSSSFLDKMRASLSGGHFRQINEKLYTCTGKEALEYFNDNSTLFNVYHTGYQQQMSSWPEQPVNIIIKWLKDHSPSLVVADFGCGDARLAKNVKNKVFSLDLVADDPSVIACDMSNTPLASASVDVAVFCLSLMGTDFSSFIQEADRLLKPSGWLLIAEVKSRFDPNNGGADPAKFINAVCELGFSSVVKDFSNKMFILLYFKKKKHNLKKKEIEWPKLKPCIYKKR